MSIDVNQMEDDVMVEHVAPENEDAKEMLERLSQKILWKSAKEVYLEWILQQIKAYEELPENKRTPAMEANYLKYLWAIDQVLWISKDKRDVKITTQLKSAADIFNSTSLD